MFSMNFKFFCTFLVRSTTSEAGKRTSKFKRIDSKFEKCIYTSSRFEPFSSSVPPQSNHPSQSVSRATVVGMAPIMTRFFQFALVCVVVVGLTTTVCASPIPVPVYVLRVISSITDLILSSLGLVTTPHSRMRPDIGVRDAWKELATTKLRIPSSQFRWKELFLLTEM
ncbi:hypothetical protein C8R41DRAFT_817660, partial [Lentinula lateritia]